MISSVKNSTSRRHHDGALYFHFPDAVVPPVSFSIRTIDIRGRAEACAKAMQDALDGMSADATGDEVRRRTAAFACCYLH